MTTWTSGGPASAHGALQELGLEALQSNKPRTTPCARVAISCATTGALPMSGAMDVHRALNTLSYVVRQGAGL